MKIDEEHPFLRSSSWGALQIFINVWYKYSQTYLDTKDLCNWTNFTLTHKTAKCNYKGHRRVLNPGPMACQCDGFNHYATKTLCLSVQVKCILHNKSNIQVSIDKIWSRPLSNKAPLVTNPCRSVYIAHIMASDGVENTRSAAILWAIYTDLHGFATGGALLESGQSNKMYISNGSVDFSIIWNY